MAWKCSSTVFSAALICAALLCLTCASSENGQTRESPHQSNGGHTVPPSLPPYPAPRAAAEGEAGIAETYSEGYTLKAMAEVNASAPAITLRWLNSTSTGTITIGRKVDADLDFTPWASLPASAREYRDAAISVGTAYEYEIYQSSGWRFDYILSGINVSYPTYRGRVILLADSTHTANLTAELSRLETDLIGDGWLVSRHDINRNLTPPEVRDMIRSDWGNGTANASMVLIIGHVPVPYSGCIAPDGHGDHVGAWAADLYYGSMQDSWTDTSTTCTGASRTQNRNQPGDGKFDQSGVPGYAAVELAVGRVDFYDMPAFPKTELELLRQYLDKDHSFRNGTTKIARRALVDDNFLGYDEGFAQSGWRLTALVGMNNVTAGDWSTLASTEYLWGYGCGGGSYTSAGGIASTSNYASTTYKAAFNFLFGSYFGDWDSTNNFLRAPLANPTYGLTDAWAGRPSWFVHRMALGEPIGLSARTSTCPGIYAPTGLSSCEVHIALMGDPTLRMEYPEPAARLNATRINSTSVRLTWNHSPSSPLGYHVFRADSPRGPYERLSPSIANATEYLDAAAPIGAYTYMVRAVLLTTSGSGSYLNPSQGIFANLNNTPPTLVGGGAAPRFGNATDTFNFSVAYMDEEDDPPAYINCVLDGSPADMQPAGSNFSSGATYYYAHAVAGLGPHLFFFNASDGEHAVTSNPLSVGVFTDSPRCDGADPMAQAEWTVDSYTNCTDTAVLPTSTGAGPINVSGGKTLNLTSTHVYLNNTLANLDGVLMLGGSAFNFIR
jgi:hypothetical protein